MPEDLENIYTQMAAIETAAMSTLGLKRVYTYAPEVLTEFPCTVRYLRYPTLRGSAGLGKQNLYFINLEYHMARGLPGGLGWLEAQCAPIVTLFQDLYMANLSLNGVADRLEFDDPISTYWGPLGWSETDTFGIRFYLWVKVTGAITVSL